MEHILDIKLKKQINNEMFLTIIDDLIDRVISNFERAESQSDFKAIIGNLDLLARLRNTLWEYGYLDKSNELDNFIKLYTKK